MGVHRRSGKGMRERLLEALLVMAHGFAGQGCARAHEIGSIAAECPYETTRPLIARRDQPLLQCLSPCRQNGEGGFS
jgi:hypothetical protein